MNFNQKTYVFRFKNICFLFFDSENNLFSIVLDLPFGHIIQSLRRIDFFKIKYCHLKKKFYVCKIFQKKDSELTNIY